MAAWYWMDGTFVPEAEAKVHVHDLGLLRGYGIFDFFPVIRGVPLFVEDYLSRFENSAQLMDLDLNFTKEELRGIILQLVKHNDTPNAYIRLLLTGGVSENGFSPQRPTLIIMQHDYEKYRAGVPKGGIKLITEQYVRDTPEAKTTNYLHVIRLRKKLAAEGAADVLYHDGKFITESSRSNFFILKKDGTLVTAKSNVLPGVTLKNLLEASKEHFKVEVRDLPLKELAEAQEAFLCSTLKGVPPVLQIDNQRIGDGKPGKWAQELQKLFQNRANRYIENKTLLMRD